MYSYIPKCHWYPFLVWCISGSRALFLVDVAAERIVASTMMFSFSRTPSLAK